MTGTLDPSQLALAIATIAAGVLLVAALIVGGYAAGCTAHAAHERNTRPKPGRR